MNPLAAKSRSRLILFILFHVSFFSLGYSMMSFSIPLYSYFRGATQLDLGIIGLLWMSPNIVIPIFLTKVKRIMKIHRLLILTIASIVPLAFLMPFLSQLGMIMLSVVVFGVLQTLWWTGIEIYLGYFSRGTHNVMALFSLVWGISFLLAPSLSGYILDSIGFHTNYTLITAIFSISLILFILQKPNNSDHSDEYVEPKEEEGEQKRDKVNYSIFLPSLAAGVTIATLSSVFPGYLRSNGLSDFAIGELFTAYASSRIFGFFLLTMATRKIQIKAFFVIGLTLQLFVVIAFFSISYMPLVLMMAIVGLGSGYAFSTPLMYIVSKKMRPLTRNVAIYEISLGISSAASSLFVGFLGQNVAINSPYVASFLIVLVLLILMLSNYKKL